jgi:hypothetical protein
MDLTSFINELSFYANAIDIGRKGLATDGEEHEGRISYERGISGTLTAFQQAQLTADPQTLIVAEYTLI